MYVLGFFEKLHFNFFSLKIFYFLPVEYFILERVVTFKASVCIFPDFSIYILEGVYSEETKTFLC